MRACVLLLLLFGFCLETDEAYLLSFVTFFHHINVIDYQTKHVQFLLKTDVMFYCWTRCVQCCAEDGSCTGSTSQQRLLFAVNADSGFSCWTRSTVRWLMFGLIVGQDQMTVSEDFLFDW